MTKKLQHHIVWTHNINIARETDVPSPAQLKTDIPITPESWKTVFAARKVIPEILHGRDDKVLVVVGPCSVHSTVDTLEYATKLAALRQRLADRMEVVMRVCPDKPRTRFSWLGFFNDPDMDGSCDIAKGWRLGRKLMLDITALGLPIAMEYLDKDNYQNVDDLVSLAWIGARSVQTQMYRQEASALSTAVGFKNPNHGHLQTAIDAIHFAQQRNAFTATNDAGVRKRFVTKGNKNGFLILRGTDEGPNYTVGDIDDAAARLHACGLIDRVVIDASHGNSSKNHLNQAEVIRCIGGEISRRNRFIAGLMYESFLHDGNQPFEVRYGKRPRVRPGISVTDGCDGWERTKRVLGELYEVVGRTPRIQEV